MKRQVHLQEHQLSANDRDILEKALENAYRNLIWIKMQPNLELLHEEAIESYQKAIELGYKDSQKKLKGLVKS